MMILTKTRRSVKPATTTARVQTTTVLFTSAKVEQDGCFGLGLGSAMATAADLSDFAAEMSSPFDGPTDAEFDAMAAESYTRELMEAGYGECSLLDLSSRMEEAEATPAAKPAPVPYGYATEVGFRTFAGHFAAIVAAAEAKVAEAKVVKVAPAPVVEPAPTPEPAAFDFAAWKRGRKNRKAGYVVPASSKVYGESSGFDVMDDFGSMNARRFANS